jgi:DNA-binding CsgD family transcriptional regulator/tetratricopeptide (TPR) repeat protein
VLEWPLVGRAEELEVLASALDDARCDGVVLMGAAGVGKTRLANEIHAIAAARHLTGVRIRASRSASDIPLAALAPLFGELAVEPDGAGEALLAVSRALAVRETDDRLVIVVDDAQELDEASATLIDHVVGARGAFVVITARAGDKALAPVLQPWKYEHVLRVQVEPIPEHDVRLLVRAVLGSPVDGGAMRQLVKASAGNMLFLRELVTGALESEVLALAEGLWTISGSLADSDRLRDLIGRRLGGLSDVEREAVELVALSEPIDLSLLAALVPTPVPEDLEQRHILEAEDGPHGIELRLAHPLYGEVVRAQLSTTRQAQLCGILAESVERVAVGRELTSREVLQVALWRLDGGGCSPELALAAARLAFLAADFRLSARLARHAWEARGDVGAARLLVDSLLDLGRTEEAEALLREASALSLSDGERAAIVARLASALFIFSGRADDAKRLLHTTLDEIDDEPGRRLLQAQLADLVVLEGDVVRAIEMARPLLEGPHDGAYAQAARDIGVCLALAGRSEEAIRHAEAGLSARESSWSLEQVSRETAFRAAHALALREAGRLEEARITAEAAYAEAVERRNRGAQAWFACVLGLIVVDQGKLTDAVNYYRETTALFGEFGHPGRRWGLGGTALASGQAGDRATAASAIAELDAFGDTVIRQMDVHVERGRAWAAVAAGDRVEAGRVLCAAAELGEGWGQLASTSAALYDLVRIGSDVTMAATRLRELADHVDGALMRARVDHAQAVLTGDPDLAVSARQSFEGCGAWLFAAEAAVLAENLLHETGRQREAVAAGIVASRLARKLDGARTPGLVPRGDRTQLSPRELEVGLLAAEGLTSKEIASKLFVSTRTVDNHLQRVYVKLGVTGRAELAERARTRTLLL